MKQVPDEMNDARLTRTFNAQMAELRSELDARITALETPADTGTSYVAPVNYLPNSAPEYSTMAYGTASTASNTAGDTNRECHNWYRFTNATTALSASSSTALKRSVSGAEHSLWAANEGTDTDIPIWDGVNGTFLIGGGVTRWDVACPLTTDFVFPGHTYYVYFEAALASTSIDLPSDLQFFCGFWDNTAGQQKWIEGSAFAPTASVYGIPGARTLEYKVLAETDSGTQILSSAIPVTTAPAAMSESSHVRLNFSGAPGFIRFVVYRKDGSTYRRVHEIRNSIDLQFYDMQETAGTLVSGYPAVSSTKPQAYAITERFEPGELSSSSFSAHTLTIKVPTTYNRSNTSNGQQWFRFGVDDFFASGDHRGVVIRRLMVSEGFGSWTRNPADMKALSSPTTSASSAPPTGTTTTEPPPPGGSGTVLCVTLDTETEVILTTLEGDQRIDKPVKTTFKDVEKGMFLSTGLLALPVKKVKTGTVQSVIKLETENGLALRCTESHRLVRSRFDRQGKAARFIQAGDHVLTCRDGIYEQTRIVGKTEVLGEETVKSVSLPAPHLFLTNGFVSHNRKLPEDELG